MPCSKFSAVEIVKYIFLETWFIDFLRFDLILFKEHRSTKTFGR